MTRRTSPRRAGGFRCCAGRTRFIDAFDLNLRVSGVTVHQVLPNANFDTGPIVLKEEVARKPGESWSGWEARMHNTEHRVLPTALKRVIHVMKHDIDVSKGQFPW